MDPRGKFARTAAAGWAGAWACSARIAAAGIKKRITHLDELSAQTYLQLSPAVFCNQKGAAASVSEN